MQDELGTINKVKTAKNSFNICGTYQGLSSDPSIPGSTVMLIDCSDGQAQVLFHEDALSEIGTETFKQDKDWIVGESVASVAGQMVMRDGDHKLVAIEFEMCPAEYKKYTCAKFIFTGVYDGRYGVEPYSQYVSRIKASRTIGESKNNVMTMISKNERMSLTFEDVNGGRFMKPGADIQITGEIKFSNNEITLIANVFGTAQEIHADYLRKKDIETAVILYEKWRAKQTVEYSPEQYELSQLAFLFFAQMGYLSEPSDLFLSNVIVKNDDVANTIVFANQKNATMSVTLSPSLTMINSIYFKKSGAEASFRGGKSFGELLKDVEIREEYYDFIGKPHQASRTTSFETNQFVKPHD